MDENDGPVELATNKNSNQYEYVHLLESNPKNKRECSDCKKQINVDNLISWELMDFCNSKCLSKYQKRFHSKCTKCSATIGKSSFGKYYQRLENSFSSFCSENCKEEYRSSAVICSFCLRDKTEKNTSTWLVRQLNTTSTIDNLPFCSVSCYRKFKDLTKSQKSKLPREGTCLVCESEKSEIILNYKGIRTSFCGKKCLMTHIFPNLNPTPEECSVCKKNNSSNIPEENIVFHKNSKLYLCSSVCRNVFTFMNKTIMTCDWCQVGCLYISMVKKHIQKVPPFVQFCSLSCFEKYENSAAALQKCSIKLHKLTNHEFTTPGEGMNKQVQTEVKSNICIPIPVPLYVPVPMAMYSIPVPYPVPFPLSIPVPIFLPIPRNTMNGVMKEVEKYKNKMCIDPCQAEMLQIADALIENEATDNCDDEFEPRVDVEAIKETEVMKNDDDDDEDTFDFEWALTDALTDIKIIAEENREKLQEDIKRKMSTESMVESNKKIKHEENLLYVTDSVSISDYSKDENYMRLDYTLGINAWKQWVSKHNSMQSIIFKSEILKMSPEEFSVALCYFVQELRKPNGDEYAPDTIYYLCLGIQFYLDQNGRFDNIFNDAIYANFTGCLDALAVRFCALYDDESHFIVTRVEEEHLWETKQLGCYSPHVLLNTLIYFNTKYYCRSNVDEHLQLSFYHILRSGKTLKSAMLRYYPLSKNPRRKRVYEMFENNEDPIRCPVRLYDYYISKCPEGAKNRYDTMYLMPEKHCTSESPVWYSSEPVPREYLAKIVNRVKMVKEINVALLSFDN